jgi:hypothetical protein
MYHGEDDGKPEAVYYGQGTAPVPAKVTIDRITPWDMEGDGCATFRIRVTDGNPSPKVIASGTFRVSGDA